MFDPAIFDPYIFDAEEITVTGDVMTTFTATQILTENGYTTVDFMYPTVEWIIDNAVDHVNLETGRSIANMTGVAGSKILTCLSEESPIIKMIVTYMLREAKKTSLTNSSSTGGSNTSSSTINVGPVGMGQSSGVSTAISAASAINSINNTAHLNFILRGFERLRRRSGERF